MILFLDYWVSIATFILYVSALTFSNTCRIFMEKMPKNISPSYDINNNESSSADSVSKATIFDLNDDCILDILEYLELGDWLNVSKVSGRFYRLITSRTLKKNEICLSDIRNHYSVRKVLRLFGPYASGIHAESTDIQYAPAGVSNTQELFQLLSKRCRSDSLRTLRLTIDVTEMWVDLCHQLAPQLAQLEHFSLRWRRRFFPPTHSRIVEDFLLMQLLQNATQLKSLGFDNLFMSSVFFLNTDFKHLEHLSFRACTAIEVSVFQAAMKKIGAQLKRFEWKNSSFVMETNYCETIANVCATLAAEAPNLVELSLEMNFNTVYCQAMSNE